MTAPPIRIILADSHAVYRLGLRVLFQQHADFEVIGEASTGEDAVQQTLQKHPNALLMDIQLLDAIGVDNTRRLVQEAPSTAVMVLSLGDEEEQVLRAIQAGATAYLSKADPPEKMLEAVRSVAEGKVYLPPLITKKVLNHIVGSLGMEKQHIIRSEKALTARELLVVQLMAKGKRNREIARMLGISERTVGNHNAHIYSKLHVSDRAQAVLYALRHGLLTT